MALDPSLQAGAAGKIELKAKNKESRARSLPSPSASASPSPSHPVYLRYISTMSPLHQVSRGGMQPPSPAKRSASKGSFKEQKPAPPQKKMSTDDLIQEQLRSTLKKKIIKLADLFAQVRIRASYPNPNPNLNPYPYPSPPYPTSARSGMSTATAR